MQPEATNEALKLIAKAIANLELHDRVVCDNDTFIHDEAISFLKEAIDKLAG
jgi:hypothetical protein